MDAGATTNIDNNKDVAGEDSGAGPRQAEAVRDEEDFSSNNPPETEREKKIRLDGPAYPDIDMDRPMFGGQAPEREAPETIDDEGFLEYNKIPTYEMSYLHIHVKQALAFFQRSLLDYLRIAFWLLETTSTFDEFALVFAGFKEWYQQTFTYFDEEQWQDLNSGSVISTTASNARSTAFDTDRAKIKRFLMCPATDDALSASDPELPASTSHCNAMQVLAGEVIRIAQMVVNVFQEIPEMDVRKYIPLLVHTTDCVKFLEFNRKFVPVDRTGKHAFELKTDVATGWPGLV